MELPIQILNSDSNLINYIYHISDIHIRLRQRHDEYEQVFDKLYKHLKKLNKNNDGLIVVTGDILHSKTHLSPECVDVTYKFFYNLSSIMPTIIIAGNHDANLSNLTRLDALSPIIDPIQNTSNKIYYLRYSGIYEYNNISFGVTSVFGLEKNESKYIRTIIKASDIQNNNKIKIALCHETLNNSKTDDGFNLKNSISINDFLGYDLGLFGDIHKRQFLNKEKTMAYSGSLIQQDKSESIKKHGFIKWDLNTKSGEFFNIKNDFGFYNMSYKNNEFIYNDEDPDGSLIHNKVRLYIEHDTSITDLDLRKKIRKNLQKRDIEIKSLLLVQINEIKDEYGIIQNESYDFNISDINKQNYYINMYMKSENSYSETEITEILDFNKEINKQLKTVEIISLDNWELETLEFSNLFSYGENNRIDLSKIKGINGFIAPNHTGKSSIIDIILYMLFDTCSRTSSALSVANEILNNTKTKFNAILIFKILNKRYSITKTGVKGAVKKDSVKVNVQFSELLEDGTTIDLNGIQRSDTKKIIEKYVGRYEDFLLTSVALQNNLKYEFIELTTGERVERLNSLLRIDIFEDLRKLVSKENEEIKVILKYNIDNSADIQEMKTDNKKIEEQLIDMNKTNHKLSSDLQKNNERIETFNSEMKVITSVVNTESLIIKKDNLLLEIEKIKNSLIELKKLNYTKEEQEQIELEHNKFEKDKSESLSQLSLKINELQNNIKNIEIPDLFQRDKMLSLSIEELNENLEKKEKNMKIKEKNLSIQVHKVNEYQKLFDSYLIYNKKDFQTIEKKYEEYKENENKKQNLQIMITMKTSKLEKLKEHQYDPNCKFCINNIFVKDALQTKKELDEDNLTMKKLSRLLFNIEEYNDYKKKFLKKQDIEIKLKEDIKNIEEKKKENIEYNSGINKIKDMIDYKNKLMKIEDDNQKIKKSLEELNILKENKTNETYDEYKKLLSFLKNKEIINNLELQFKNNNYELEKINYIFLEEKINIDNLEINKNCKIKINQYKTENEYINTQLKKLEKTMCDLNIKKALQDQKIQEYIINEKKISEYRKRHHLFEKYIKLMNKNGLPYYLISKIIPTLEQRINTILRKLTSFQIKIELEQKKSQKNINIYLVREDTEIPILLASGFELFITNIVFKLAIRSISKIPKGNFFIIDEGFGNMDDSNLSSVSESLFQYLKLNFDYTLIISHIDTLRDYLDKEINITKIDDLSFIFY